MKRAIFLDIEGTLTETFSRNSKTLNSGSSDFDCLISERIKVLPNVETALDYYSSREPEQLIVGISNKGSDGEIFLEDLEDLKKGVENLDTDSQNTGSQVDSSVDLEISDSEVFNSEVLGVNNPKLNSSKLENPQQVDVSIPQLQSNVDIVVEEMRYTLSLLPQLKAIYFCPNTKGRSCWRVTRTSAVKISNNFRNQETYISEKHSFRKPGAGMIFVAALDYDIDLDQSWMVGTNVDDENAAANAQIDYMSAVQWRNQFVGVS